MISSENATFAYIHRKQYVAYEMIFSKARKTSGILCTIWEYLKWYVNYTKQVHNYNVVLALTFVRVYLLFCLLATQQSTWIHPHMNQMFFFFWCKWDDVRLPTVCIGSSWQIGTAVTQLNNLLEQHTHAFKPIRMA